MDYKFREIEKKWQKSWKESKIYHVKNDNSKPKSYVLDMFPYPSGAGLHVGHPLGYIASDVYSRYKRLKGFNVLHPMGFDAFGLPAEQYAIETGQHPATTTDNNIKTFKKQMDNIGFCFDWSREVRTSEPNYYQWTQWIFLKLFNSWYNRQKKQAQSIDTLVRLFEKEGNKNHECPGDEHNRFTSEQWKSLNEKAQQDILMNYRLAYSGVGEVNWCEALGTVLANDEVVNGVSERGGHPVIKKKLRQWYLRITEYADRLLEGLKSVEFSDAMKEMQSNWIGRSEGVDVKFNIKNHEENMVVYTTRPDTIFGVDFMVLAPEHELINQIKTKEEEDKVDQYVAYASGRSERERIAEKKITGCFTGSYAINPLNGKEIPIWISEYVLSGYGTGAVMAVPCGDERDHRFAKHFNIPITNIIGDYYNGEEANPTKDATLQNSAFLDGIKMEDALPIISDKIEEKGLGQRKINFKMRDASFSRQRYWGEPFPIEWQNGNAYALDEKDLPLELPHVETYQPGPEGEGPLANIADWTSKNLETNTMPGYAGSSWYFLRYMDPHNAKEFASKEATEYWNQVDVYVGGTEHAVGHLLYSRLWTKVLFDLGYINFEEPFKKLINQGKITGDSRLVYRVHGTNKFVSKGLKKNYKTDPLHVNVNFVDGFELNTKEFKTWKPEFKEAEFILEDGKYICGSAIEKMSKSLYNTVNPDAVVEEYGADTFRMYEMFLGPIEQSKPWDTKGIEGVSRFLKKLWRLFYDREKWIVNNEKATEAELRILHKTIKKVMEDSENFSFNTAVSQFMICVNELTSLKSHKKEILEPLIISLTPYAPHISEELWHQLGHEDSILNANFPDYNEKYLKESTITYPIAINGKTRLTLSFDAEADKETIKSTVLDNEVVQKWINGKNIRQFILVPNRMINVVV